MPEQSTLKINEIFWSFQGEGLRAGFASIFVRLAGCSLGCHYCDTKDAWEGGIPLPVSEVVKSVDNFRNRYPQSQVVLTGGEPMEQELEVLTTVLKDQNYFVTIETNGCEYSDLPIDWWTVSPKDVAGYAIHDGLIERMDEVKVIVNKNLTIDVVKEIRAMGEHFPIFLQPDSTDHHRFSNVFSFFERCQEEGINDVRPGIQLHKIYQVQ